ncbi:MAG: sulfotransferase [Chromatiales bacterium]|nr:sulfotransferase [Chromatiales bacterium]
MITPVFLFSLPRSGSTLTQHVLATHQNIDTAAEPWILLPFLYSLRREGVYAEYGHKLAVDAIEDFADSLPGGEHAYLHEIGAMVLRLYAAAEPLREEQRVLWIRAARYHLVAEGGIQLFDAGRFIFLWRNPLSIISSMMETWAQGRWNLYAYDMDLHTGLVPDRCVVKI